MAAQTELTAHLATAREALRRQAQRADPAEPHRKRAAGQIEQLATELTPARQQIQRWQAQTAEHRADLAAARADLLAAMGRPRRRTHPTPPNASPTNEAATTN